MQTVRDNADKHSCYALVACYLDEGFARSND